MASGGGHWDGTIKLWDVVSRKEVATLEGRNVNSVAFSPDGKLLASGSADGHRGPVVIAAIKIWDVAGKKELAMLKGGELRTRSIAFSPDGKLLASANLFYYTIMLWDIAGKKDVATIDGNTWFDYAYYSVAFSPDGRLLASASQDGTVLLWNMSGSGVVNVAPGDKQQVTWGKVKMTKLFQNYPNPFNPDTWIPYQLKKESDVSISIYDITGRLVRRLELGHKSAGIMRIRRGLF